MLPNACERRRYTRPPTAPPYVPEDIATMKVGVKAIAPHPVKSSKRDPGMRNVVVSFAGLIVKPGDWIYADMDGILVYPEKLTL